MEKSHKKCYLCSMITSDEIKAFFSNLVFDESSHTYSLIDSPKNIWSSVTNLTKQFKQPFEKEQIANAIAKRDGISVQEVLDGWNKLADEACQMGTVVHRYGEQLFYKNTVSAPSIPQEAAIQAFWDELPDTIVPIASELQMYHKKYLFAGTMDLLLYDKRKDKFVIADYKTNKDLFKNYKKKKLLTPFDDMLDCPLSLYSLQLSLYKLLLEQIDGIHVGDCKVVWLKSDGTYDMYNTINCENHLNAFLENRYRNADW